MPLIVDLYKYWSPTKDVPSGRNAWSFSDQTQWAHPEWHPWKWLEPCHKLLDLGCGRGQMVANLRQLGKEAYGVTYQERELGAEYIALGDMHDLQYPDASFDGVIIWDSLEHCISPFIALAEARRVTRPGGRGVIFMPGEKWIEADYHLYVLNIRQMTQLLKLTGWTLCMAIDCGEAQPEAAFYLLENTAQ